MLATGLSVLPALLIPAGVVGCTSNSKPKTTSTSKASDEKPKEPSCKLPVKPSEEKPSMESDSKSKVQEDDEITDPAHPEEIITRKKDKKKLDGEDNRTAWARYALERPCRRLAKQFTKKVKKFVAVGKDGKPLPTVAHDANQEKNRYSDVVCIDSTRIVLKDRASDYIHASWFTLPDQSQKYICAQGPLKETIEDFWYMIYQEKTKMLIMLCQLVEGNTEKCCLYWPTTKGQQEKYGDMTVTNVEQKPDPIDGVLLTYLDVQYKAGETIRIWHVLVTWWPDQLAPSDTAPIFELKKWVKKNNEKGSTITVHCSAGVGRTSTFVGLDYATQRIKEDFTMEMSDIIREMRTMRPQAIQSHLQYIFLHVLVFDHFQQEGYLKKNEKLTKFLADYQKIANKKLKKRKEEDVKTSKESPDVVRKTVHGEKMEVEEN